MLEIFSSNNYF